MNKQLITIDGKDYWFKIGLRGIIYLQSLSQYDESDFFAAGLITFDENHLSPTAAKELYSKGLFKRFIPSLVEQVSFFSIDFQGLYSQAVGEIGIDPNIALQMSPGEIELAYKGYQKRQETLANIIKIAVLESLQDNTSPISLTEPDEFAVGNMVERQSVCEVLLNE